MEIPPSRRRIRRAPLAPPATQGGTGEDDRISALPDDMLLQILARLGCARAAARTSVLARRWRNLWICLPGLTFRDVQASKVQAVLTRVARGADVPISVLDIHLARTVPREAGKSDDVNAKKLLLCAARLSPEELVFVLPRSCVSKPGRRVELAMPSFHRATSIELDTHFLRVKPVPDCGALPSLERLSLSGDIVNPREFLNLCPRLRVLRITFRGGDPNLLEEALATLQEAVALGLTVSLLGIEHGLNNGRYSVDGAGFASLLCAAARINPQEFVFGKKFHICFTTELPCFPGARSIEMRLNNVCFTKLLDDKFLALDSMSLQGPDCTILDIATMIARCPCLRVLKVNAHRSAPNITVHSASLQELELGVYGAECPDIHIDTPLLRLLKLSVYAYPGLDVSISVPMVEKVSWFFSYTKLDLLFGLWALKIMGVETIENYKDKDGRLTKEGKDACSEPLHAYVLSLHISAHDQLGPVMNFARELEKVPVSNIAVLELHLNAKRHFLASFVLHLLKMHQLQSTTKVLKLFLSRWPEMSTCLKYCPCNDPNEDWSSQSISLNHLEQVEINNFKGGDREFDFLTLILRWAPMLTRMTIKLTSEINPSDIGDYAKSIYSTCFGHPFVKPFVYLSNGELVPCF